MQDMIPQTNNTPLSIISKTLQKIKDIQKLQALLSQLNSGILSHELSTLINTLQKQPFHSALQQSQNQHTQIHEHLPKYKVNRHDQLNFPPPPIQQPQIHQHISQSQSIHMNVKQIQEQIELQELGLPKMQVKSQSTFHFDLDLEDFQNQRECQMKFVEVSQYGYDDQGGEESGNSVFREWGIGKIF